MNNYMVPLGDKESNQEGFFDGSSDLERRYFAILRNFEENGFTLQQSEFLVKFLDDYTEIPIQLNNKDLKLIKIISELSSKYSNGNYCKPTLKINSLEE